VLFDIVSTILLHEYFIKQPSKSHIMTHLENRQDIMIVDHVTEFYVVNNVIGTMLEDMLGEGGSSQQVSQNDFQQPTREHGQNWTKSKELLQIEAPCNHPISF
jgi:hypothetical protein